MADFDPDADWQQQRLDEMEEARRDNVRHLRGQPAGPRDSAPHRPSDAEQSGPRYNGLLSSAAFMARMRPPCYMLDGVIQRGNTYSITGNTGHGKTAAALLLCLCVATGEPFCGRKVRKGAVLFLAGENADNVRLQWFALCSDQGVDPAGLPIHWHDGNFNISGSLEALFEDAERIPDLELVVADTLQAFFAGDDDNSNPQMIQAARDFRSLTKLPSRPTVLIPAHPVKNAARDNLVPRGGSAFLNEIDGNLALHCAHSIVTIDWQGKHRGPSFDPIKLEMVRVEPSGMVDDEGRQMPGTVARPLATVREEQIAEAAEDRETAALHAIQSNPGLSIRGLADALGMPKTTAERVRTELERRKWIRPHGRHWELTPSGEAALEDGGTAA